MPEMFPKMFQNCSFTPNVFIISFHAIFQISIDLFCFGELSELSGRMAGFASNYGVIKASNCSWFSSMGDDVGSCDVFWCFGEFSLNFMELSENRIRFYLWSSRKGIEDWKSCGFTWFMFYERIFFIGNGQRRFYDLDFYW